ncbi:hypothetical protein Hanom_Chr14g01267421 [Helianthus anomalus]
MLKQAPTNSSLKDMMLLLVLYARIVRITFRSRHGYMLILFQKLIMKRMVMSGRNGIQYRWFMQRFAFVYKPYLENCIHIYIYRNLYSYFISNLVI